MPSALASSRLPDELAKPISRLQAEAAELTAGSSGDGYIPPVVDGDGWFTHARPAPPAGTR
jgi:hypothetical protein